MSNVAELSEQQASARSAAESGGQRSVIKLAAAIRSKRVRWLWRGYDPLGYLTISTGESKLGKTTFQALKIARLTRGELPGELEHKPQAVLVIAAEDGLADMWKPRLVAAGADLERVAFIQYPDHWNVRDGVPLVRDALDQMPAALVFVDAVMEHMPDAHGSENANSVTFVRQALRPLARLAEERGVSIGISTHPPKGRPGSFADAYHGSGAFTQVSRSCLLFGWHPDDRELPEDDRRRVILRAAGNVGRNPGACSFRIGGREIDLDDGSRDEIAYAFDLEPCSVTARDLLSADRIGAPMSDSRAAGSKVEAVVERIAAYLADGDWHPSIRRKLEAEGYAAGTVGEALKRVADVRKTPGSMKGEWQWRRRSSSSSDTSTDREASRARSVSPLPDTSTDRPQKPSKYRSVEVSDEFDGASSPNHEVSKCQDRTEATRAHASEPGSKIGYENRCSCADGGEGGDERCGRCSGHRPSVRLGSRETEL